MNRVGSGKSTLDEHEWRRKAYHNRGFPRRSRILRISLLLIAPLLVLLAFVAPHPTVAQEAGGSESFRFEFVELRGRDGGALAPIPGQPVGGATYTARARLTGPLLATAKFRFVTMDGASIRKIAMATGSPHAAPTAYVGEVEVPRQPFRVSLVGLDKRGKRYDALTDAVFHPQAIEVRVDPKSAARLLIGENTFLFEVTNHGPPDSFRLIIGSNDVFASPKVTPDSVTLGTDEVARFEAEVTVPVNTPEMTLVYLIASMTSTTDPDASNTATLTLLVQHPDSVPQPTTFFQLDILPGLCDNLLDLRSDGALPVIVLGRIGISSCVYRTTDR